MRNKKKNDITQGWGVLQSLISPSKVNEKKEVIATRGIRLSPIQVRTRQNRPQLCRADDTWCCPCGIVTLNATVFNFYDEKR